MAAPPRPVPQGGLAGFHALLGRSSPMDLLFKGLCYLAAWSVIGLFVALIVILVVQSWLAIATFGPKFLWTYAPGNLLPTLGALPYIYGTLVTSLIAMIIALPLGVGTAAYLSEIASGWVRRVGAFLVELLAAIPSVVYGFWGLNFLAVGVQGFYTIIGGPNTGGKGILSAGIILAIMILPFITAISYDVCQAVPRTQREGALALSATRWQMIWTVILPYARPGIIGGAFLALGRALGETMAVVMLIGNVPRIENPLTGRGASIPSAIANGLGDVDTAEQQSSLVELALVLLLVTIIIGSLARFLIWQMQTRPGSTGFFRSLYRRFRPTRIVPRPAAVETPRLAPSPAPPLPSNRSAQVANHVMTGVLTASLVVTCGPLFLILGYIFAAGTGSLFWVEDKDQPAATSVGANATNAKPETKYKFSLAFFIHDVNGNLPNESFTFGDPGLGNAMLGTMILVVLATLGAVPIGLLAAIFLVEVRQSRLAGAVRFVGELLGGVPSIILGIMSYALLGPKSSGWAGAFALAVMMIPIVMRAAEEALKLVPQSLRNASYALGAEYWQTIVRVSVPAALPAIITGVFLAMARIAGETAPLLFTARKADAWTYWPGSPFPYLTYWIYNGSREYNPVDQRLAWGGAVILLLFVMALNIGIRLASGKRLVTAGSAE